MTAGESGRSTVLAPKPAPPDDASEGEGGVPLDAVPERESLRSTFAVMGALVVLAACLLVLVALAIALYAHHV